jgi:hypothetical protein
MGAKQAYSIIHGLAYLPLCFLGITALLISIIAIVSINPIVVSIFVTIKKTGSICIKYLSVFLNQIDFYWFGHMC